MSLRQTCLLHNIVVKCVGCIFFFCFSSFILKEVNSRANNRIERKTIYLFVDRFIATCKYGLMDQWVFKEFDIFQDICIRMYVWVCTTLFSYIYIYI